MVLECLSIPQEADLKPYKPILNTILDQQWQTPRPVVVMPEIRAPATEHCKIEQSEEF